MRENGHRGAVEQLGNVGQGPQAKRGKGFKETCLALVPSSSQRWGASGQQGCPEGGIWPNRSPALRFHHLSSACQGPGQEPQGEQGEDWGLGEGRRTGEEGCHRCHHPLR